MRSGDAGAKQINRLAPEIAGAVGPHQHARRASISDEAAIGDRQRVADHAALQDVLDGKRAAGEGLGVSVGPFASCDGDRRKILSRGPILMHVSGGRHRVPGDRMPGPIGRLVPLRLAHGDQTAAGRALVRPVGDQRNVAEPRLKSHSSLHQMDLERRAADVRSLDVARLEAEIFDGGDGG